MDVLVLVLLACRTTPEDPGLSAVQIQGYVRKGTKDAGSWAEAVHGALQADGRKPSEDSVCQVLAVIEQESGYTADPVVPGLSAIALRELEASISDRLGMFGDDALSLVLDVTPEGATQTFRARLADVRTERDLDRLYRDLVAHHEGRVPGVAAVRGVLAPQLAERENPVTTAGSMQVSVAWALDQPVSKGLTADEVRERLYTVQGGVLYGTLRLFDQDTPYEAPIHRFADFNAGQWASRNAAFQDRIADLSGVALTLDGDLLAYNRRGRARSEQTGETVSALVGWARTADPELTEARILHDLRSEKSQGLERTRTWTLVNERWTAAHGALVYARVPDVALDSPKLTGDWTTKTFAERVQRRYTDCRARR